MTEFFHWSCYALMLIGAFFVLTSALGVVRFPDVYTRLHATSKGATFGFCFLIIGASLLMGTERDVSKALVAVVFQFLTAPIGAHMIARVGLKKGVRPVGNSKGEPMEAKEGIEEIKEIPPFEG